MDLQMVCRDVMDDVDGSLGCVLTDLETGLPLASEYRAGTIMDAKMVALVSYVGIDLFRGKLVRNFERTLSRTHASSEGFVREVQLTTNNTYQFMSAVPGWDQVIFILVTDKNVSLGMGLLAVHDAVRRLGETPLHSTAPAVNPTFRPREEASGPSTPPPNWDLEPRQPEPQYNGAIDAPPPPPRHTRFEPLHPQTEAQHERLAETVARAPVAPEPAPPQSPPPQSPPPQSPPSPEVVPTEAVTPPAESQVSPAVETPEAATSSSETEDSAPQEVPIGPRARMFFKRTGEDKRKNRRRRS